MEKYLDIIYQYYPQYIYATDPNYSYTPEIINLFKMLEMARLNNQTFEKLMTDSIHTFDPFAIDFSLHGVFGCSYMAWFAIPEIWGIQKYRRCVFNISVISNYYSIYLTQIHGNGPCSIETGSANEQERTFIAHIAKQIKLFFPDYVPFPMEYFHEKVPNVYAGSGDPFSYATYFDCLITNHILY
jgi:hypothetical protein